MSGTANKKKSLVLSLCTFVLLQLVSLKVIALPKLDKLTKIASESGCWRPGTGNGTISNSSSSPFKMIEDLRRNLTNNKSKNNHINNDFYGVPVIIEDPSNVLVI